MKRNFSAAQANLFTKDAVCWALDIDKSTLFRHERIQKDFPKPNRDLKNVRQYTREEVCEAAEYIYRPRLLRYEAQRYPSTLETDNEQNVKLKLASLNYVLKHDREAYEILKNRDMTEEETQHLADLITHFFLEPSKPEFCEMMSLLVEKSGALIAKNPQANLNL